MADTEQIIDDAPVAQPPKSKKMLTILLAAGLIVGEGAGIFIMTRMMYKQPATAEGAELTEEEQAVQAVEESVEIPLPEVNAFNKREGRLFLFNLHVSILVHKDRAEEVQKVLTARESTVLDRLNTVIRSADVKYLNEPGLDTLRRQFRFELNQVLGDDTVIEDLLIPKFYQSPADL
ncbi:MAG: hypothetical protein H6817_11485 [Phycisphaerales bacterium]|nr:hypothetical protein [Phycisphaerales bacterium]